MCRLICCQQCIACWPIQYALELCPLFYKRFACRSELQVANPVCVPVLGRVACISPSYMCVLGLLPYLWLLVHSMPVSLGLPSPDTATDPVGHCGFSSGLCSEQCHANMMKCIMKGQWCLAPTTTNTSTLAIVLHVFLCGAVSHVFFSTPALKRPLRRMIAKGFVTCQGQRTGSGVVAHRTSSRVVQVQRSQSWTVSVMLT